MNEQDGRMKGWMSGWMDALMDDGWKCGGLGALMSGWVSAQMDGSMGEQMDFCGSEY